MELLQKINERFYLDKVIDFFIRFFSYDNEELGSVLIVLFSILSTEIASHFFFNTMLQGGLAHLALAGLIMYAFLVHIIFSKDCRLYLEGILEVLIGIAVGIIIEYKI